MLLHRQDEILPDIVILEIHFLTHSNLRLPQSPDLEPIGKKSNIQSIFPERGMIECFRYGSINTEAVLSESSDEMMSFEFFARLKSTAHSLRCAYNRFWGNGSNHQSTIRGGQTHLSPIRCDWQTRAHFGISADDASQRRSSSLYKNSSLTPRPASAPKFSTHP